MNRDKKEIILNEIDTWRRSRLLPEHYCDFLENLYRDEKSASTQRVSSTNSVSNWNKTTWMISIGIISFIFFIGFYFSSFPWPLQIAVSLLSCIGLYLVSGAYRDRNDLFSLVLAGLGSILLMGLGGWSIILQNAEQSSSWAVLILICGIVWLIAGSVLRFGILQFCGFTCGILLCAFMFRRIQPEASIWLLQLLWLPLSCLTFWLSWFSHHRIKRIARVFFALSLLLWFLPELDGVLLRDQSFEAIIFSFLLKLVTVILVLFILRKKWVVWITS